MLSCGHGFALFIVPHFTWPLLLKKVSNSSGASVTVAHEPALFLLFSDTARTVSTHADRASRWRAVVDFVVDFAAVGAG